LKWLNENGDRRFALLLHTLHRQEATQVVKLYDARGGTIESDLQEDKLGLQLLRRRKRCWEAQEAWVILSDLAHNLLVWSKDWMWRGSRFEQYGMMRLVQDVLNIPGSLEFKGEKLCKVSLQRTHPFASDLQSCLSHLFKELC
jgi:hypothetical protein